MATQIINIGGSPFGLKISPEGAAAVSGLLTAVISGGIHIGSVTANVDSIYVQSGANMVGSMYVPAGSMIVTNYGVLGSSRVIENVVGVTPSGTFDVTSAQSTNPWVTSGTSTVAGSVFTTGSNRILEPSTIGSYTSMALGSSTITNFSDLGSNVTGSVAIVTNPVPISGKHIPGSVYQVTNPWITSGTSTVAGSIFTTGSMRILAPSTIGSYTSQVLGSQAITNFGAVGSSRVVTNFGDLGSSRLINGSVVIKEVIPIDASKNNGVGSLVYTGDLLGSIVKNIGGTEYVKVLTYSGAGNCLIGIGSWVEL